MRKVNCGVLLITAGFALQGCGTLVTLAPQADHVRVTKDARDVSACQAVGNVDAHDYALDPQNAMRQMRNETVGLNGNTLFVTFDPADHAIDPPGTYAKGIAYRCATNPALD